MRARFISCDLPGLPAGVGEKDDDMKNFFHQHVKHVREFVMARPTLSLVEFQLEDEASGEYLASIFPQLNATLWKQANTGGYHKVVSKEVMEKKDDAVAEKALHDIVVKTNLKLKESQTNALDTQVDEACLRPIMKIQGNATNDFRNGRIANVGMPKSGSSSIEDLFRGSKGRLNDHYTRAVSHFVCIADFEYGQRVRRNKHRRRLGRRGLRPKQHACGLCMKYAIKAGKPPFETCGNYQVFAQMDNPFPDGTNQTGGDCYFPVRASKLFVPCRASM